MPDQPTASFDDDADPTRTHAHKAEAEADPPSLGRYTILRRLGSGGFGVVYLAHDATLDRVVAIKAPRTDKLKHDQVGAYLAEARTLAGLEHPAIVRVYDCGTDNNRSFVVSQYVDGGDLADYLKLNSPDYAWAARLVVRIAEALHHAHKARIVHRDVKPANILLDSAGTAYLADFGLAMKEQDFGRGSGYAGTPRYMSPEQARREGHRVDGRSDIYSLGVVLYEMLCGRAPFLSESLSELLDQIQHREPPPMKLEAADLPSELDRIVMKALAKKAADRYAVAQDLADDLNHWLGGPVASVSSSDVKAARIVPKGLRAFDANDADFFLRLVPGAKDRDGVPESIRSWVRRIESRSHAVCLLYGPSGGGKSSFVKAGVLPRLSEAFTVVRIDASPTETESRLKAALGVNSETLSDALTEYRRSASKPLVLVIDQFEQWLAANPALSGDLVNALRQCDGTHIQALLLVRDDFWMSATRLFQALEISLTDGENSAAADLLDAELARKTLASFGRAYGRLPSKRAETTAEQEQFLDRAVAGLAENGRVVSVRLALFAEMTKTKPWNPATLDSIGGLAGVGEAYLDDTFGTHAPPAHKYHAAAIKAVLSELLPPPGMDIKASPVAKSRLQELAGSEFDAVMKILDTDLHLVTPADGAEPRFALTHDFLVPSLRAWLDRDQRGTAKGRAQLLLTERTAVWKAKPQRRHEPSTLEWLRIVTLATPKNETERALLRRTTRHKLTTFVTSAVFVAACVWFLSDYQAGVRKKERIREGEALVEQLKIAQPLEIPGILDKMGPLRDVVDPLLDNEIERFGIGDPRVIRFKLTLIVEDPEILATVIPRLPAELKSLGWFLYGRRPGSFDVVAENLATIPDDQFVPLLRHWKNDVAAAKTLNVSAPNVTMTLLEPGSDVRFRARQVIGQAVLGDIAPLRTTLNDNGSVAAAVIEQLAAVKWNEPNWADEYANATTAAGKMNVVFLLPPDTITPLMEAEYKTHPNVGVHSALEWYFKNRQTRVLNASNVESTGRPTGGKNWYVTKSGQTMVVFSPVKFTMGAADNESVLKDEKGRHERTMPRRFAVATTEVTSALFQKFLAAREQAFNVNRQYSPTDDCPAGNVSWIDAAAFCNWLSEVEGIPESQHVYNGYDPVSVADDALQRTGYRLPTEAEWEYVARAGSAAPRFYGSNDNLLPHYAWTAANSNGQLHPVGKLKPNAFGMFDILGNVQEWTMDEFVKGERYPKGPARDEWKGPREFDANSPRVIRGGSILQPAIDQRSARRFAAAANTQDFKIGFRLARTLPPEER